MTINSDERHVATSTLSRMFLSLEDRDQNQPGYDWSKGRNDALRQAMNYAQPAPSLASDDVSLISGVKTQPTQNVKDAIIDDLQSQFDTEGITEHDSGDALIRLSDAIAAVEDNFALAQPATSIPEGWKLVPIEPTEKMINEGTCAATLPGPRYIDSACAKHCWEYMLAAAPEAKPCP